jgi:hypothetical protein
MAMTTEYLAGMHKSYPDQTAILTISPADLDRIIEIPIGFQPVGIAAQNIEGGDQVVIAAYFEPAICVADVRRDETGLHFAVNWIRSVDHGVQIVRLFPDVFRGDANRLQSVNFGPDGTLWLNRNGDRDFYVLAPPVNPGDRWTLAQRYFLPRTDRVVHSTLRIGGLLFTVESPTSFEGWALYRYETSFTTGVFVEANRWVHYGLFDWKYGIAQSPGKTDLWTVTDFRIQHYKPEISPGIYRGMDLVVPGVFGNGICFLSDGSALVTRYGQGHPSPFNGVPGALIYIPAGFFSW